MEGRVNGASCQCVVQAKRPAISFLDFKPLESKNGGVEQAAKGRPAPEEHGGRLMVVKRSSFKAAAHNSPGTLKQRGRF